MIIDATIEIGGILVKCYFFSEDEIENGIIPLEIETLEHHNQLLSYLKAVSKILNKEVILTEENYSASPQKLITVNNEQVLVS